MDIKIELKRVVNESRQFLNELDKATRKNLVAVGMRARSHAKRSIRKRRRASEPGKPPRNVTGLLKNFILFAVDQTKSVVIGPVPKPSTSPGVPAALEHGGSTIGTLGHSIQIEKRPYMVPAMDKTRQDIRSLWTNTP